MRKIIKNDRRHLWTQYQLLFFQSLANQYGSRDSTKRLGDHIGGMIIELKPSEERTIRTKELIKLWKGSLPEMEGLRNLTIKEKVVSN